MLPNEMSVVLNEFKPQHDRKHSITSLNKDYIGSQVNMNMSGPRQKLPNNPNRKENGRNSTL